MKGNVPEAALKEWWSFVTDSSAHLSSSTHLSFNHVGRWGTKDDFATSFLHFSLFSTALWDFVNSRPVLSLMLSSHLFLCLPCLLHLSTEGTVLNTSKARTPSKQSSTDNIKAGGTLYAHTCTEPPSPPLPKLQNHHHWRNSHIKLSIRMNRLTICDTAKCLMAWTRMATSNIWAAISPPCLVPSMRVSSTRMLTYLPGEHTAQYCLWVIILIMYDRKKFKGANRKLKVNVSFLITSPNHTASLNINMLW